MYGNKKMKNNIIELFIQYKYNLVFVVYVLATFIVIDNNSNFELTIKGIILFGLLLSLNKNEATKIFFIFYLLFCLIYCLFFIVYFFAHDESSANLANILFILSYIFFLPIYISISIIIIFKNTSVFFKNNFILFFSIILGSFLPYFGFERGLINMRYTTVDIFLFLLIILQLLVALYFYKKKA